VADGKPALMRQIREPDLPIQVFLYNFSHSTLLPRRQSTAIYLHCIKRWSVTLRDISAKQQTEMIEEEFTKHLRSG